MKIGFRTFLMLLFGSFLLASRGFNGPAIVSHPEEQVDCCSQLFGYRENQVFVEISAAEPVHALPVCFVVDSIQLPQPLGQNIFGAAGPQESTFAPSQVQYEDLELHLDYLLYMVDRLESYSSRRRH